MNILVEVAEATVRLEELIELMNRGDEILICRDKRPIAVLAPITQYADAYDNFFALLAEGRKSVPAGNNSDHSDLYDENGLPK